MNTKVGLLVLALAASAPAAAQQAVKGNPDAAKSKVSMCVGCHGIPDYKTAFPSVYHVPKIAGQSADYLAAALNAYKSGDRVHPSMQGIAVNAHAWDAGKGAEKAKQVCAACHG